MDEIMRDENWLVYGKPERGKRKNNPHKVQCGMPILLSNNP
jgi:hypothetical protein